MRTPHLISSALLFFTVPTLMNCQVVIGVSDLEITGGAGGNGGNSSSSTSSSSGNPICSGCLPHYGCNANGVCNTTCNGTADCAEGSVCLSKLALCMECGASGADAPCPGKLHDMCNMCETGTNLCTSTCDMPGECTASRVIDVGGTPLRLECNEQCNDVTLTFVGAGPIEVVCTAGCNRLTVMCAAEAPCTLTCNGSGCVEANINCGFNTCLADCQSTPVKVNQVCNNSCSCQKMGCQ